MSDIPWYLLGGLTIVALGLLAEPREEGLAARVSVMDRLLYTCTQAHYLSRCS